MYKPLVILSVLFCVIEARPWQWLPPRDGYVPVYIRPGDTPLEEINPDLAEAFHALPAGRSAGKHLDAAPENPEAAVAPEDPVVAEDPVAPKDPVAAETPVIAEAPETQEQADLPRADPDTPEDTIDHRPYEKKVQEKKVKKATEITKPVERR